MKHFVYTDTARRTWKHETGRTWSKIYQTLCDKGVMHYESYERYICDCIGLDYELLGIDKEGEYNDNLYYNQIESYNIEDNEYIDIMSEDIGNAYYQYYYDSTEDYNNNEHCYKR